MMLYFLNGWLIHARKRNQYFVVDQVAAHALSLLNFIDGLGELPTPGESATKMFRYLKLDLVCRQWWVGKPGGHDFHSLQRNVW